MSLIGEDGYLTLPEWSGVRLVRDPAPADKVYTDHNTGRWLFPHSVVGSAVAAKHRLMSTQRGPDGRYTAFSAASWLWTNRKDNRLEQHYPVWASTWTSGGREANCNGWAWENEGGPPGNESEPWTDDQVNAGLWLCLVNEEWNGAWYRTRRIAGSKASVLLEHNETHELFGYPPTACPSGRNQRLYDAIANGELDRLRSRLLYGEDDVPNTQYEDLILSVFSGSEDRIPINEGESLADYLVRDRAKRLENAIYRMTEAANARDRSVRDYAVSSVSLWQRIIRLVPGLSREA